MKANTAVIIDTRKSLKNGTYPIKLRVTFNRKQKYYPADLKLTQIEYDMVTGKSPKGDYKKYKLQLEALEQKANEIIDSMSVFDFASFSRSLYSDQQVRDDVYAYYPKMIDYYTQKGNLGTAYNYNCSLVSLKKFRSKLTFIDVTVDFLEEYENWMLGDGKSVTTVSMYVRSLRAIINNAKAAGVLSKEYNYPFGSKSKQKYQIPTSKNVKKALTLPELKLLFDYKPEIDSWKEKALDFWIFSYLANGMNMKDIADLQYKDLDGEYIKFIRAKTSNTNRVVTPISVYQTDKIKLIIAKWGNADKMPDNLIFPILNVGDSLEKQRADLKQFIKMVNKYMAKIAEKVGIKKPCTTYYARHSFATVLLRSGASMEFIKEALGHSNLSTTENYLDGFEDDAKKDMAKALTNF